MCQAYNWTIDQALKVTIPQIILLNHAAHVNRKRADERVKSEDSTKKYDEENPVVMNGKTVDQLNEAELGAYFMTFNNWN